MKLAVPIEVEDIDVVAPATAALPGSIVKFALRAVASLIALTPFAMVSMATVAEILARPLWMLPASVHVVALAGVDSPEENEAIVYFFNGCASFR